MNKWVQKSIELAKSKGYLDNLFRVYPVEMGISRIITDDLQSKLVEAFKSHKGLNLIKELLKFPRFPIDDPYLASLRRHPILLEKNPATIKRISQKLFSIGIDEILELSIKPKSASRQFGNIFQRWLLTRQYNFLEWEEFKKAGKLAFLEGSDNTLKNFAQKETGIKNLKRRPDFIAKARGKFILGEAKFLTDYGGTQNNQFDGAIKTAMLKNKNAFGIAVIDGIVWFENNSYMHKKVKASKDIILSALLLEEFFNEF